MFEHERVPKGPKKTIFARFWLEKTGLDQGNGFWLILAPKNGFRLILAKKTGVWPKKVVWSEKLVFGPFWLTKRGFDRKPRFWWILIDFGQNKRAFDRNSGLGRFWPEKLVGAHFGCFWLILGLRFGFISSGVNTRLSGIRTQNLRCGGSECYHWTS